MLHVTGYGLCQELLLISNHSFKVHTIFCRAIAAENRVEEIVPSGSAFLGDSSMKYVRITSSLGYFYLIQ